MKTTGKLIISFAFLTLAMTAYARSPRDEVQQLTAQLQKTPYDNVLREKIVKLAIGIKPVLAIPEEARRSFIIGETMFKQAKTLRPAYEAANAFQTASTLAPWWGEAYWNLAVAQQFIGQYVGAKESLRFYLLTNLSAADRRAAQDRLYAIDADIMLAASSTTGGITGFWQETSHQDNGVWKDNPQNLLRPAYEIQQAGSTYRITCIFCDTASQYKWTVNVVSASTDAITYQMRMVSPSYDSGTDTNECRLSANQLHCARTGSKGEKYFYRLAKRSVCELVGGAGDIAFVLCK